VLRFSIVIPIYNQYELLRQCIESIFHYIDDKPSHGYGATSFKELIIVDDYSNPNSKLNEYISWLGTLLSIKVVKSDEYRLSIHCGGHHLEVAQKRNDPLLKGININKATRGHGFALQTGINEVTSDFVFCIDADCVFLSNSSNMFKEIIKIFDEYSNVMCVGQIAGFMTDMIMESKEIFTYDMNGRNMNLGGCPGSPAFACRMRGWKEKGIKPIAGAPTHRGWALSAYSIDLYDKGFSMFNYPIFSQKNIFHMGGVILKYARFGGEAGIGNIKFGMLKDGNDYGGRRGSNLICHWYQGRYILNMNTRQYIEYLKMKYNKPFDQIQNPLNENLLYVAEERKPRRKW